ncbi:hypothetical protein F5148DRAFT_1149589 [Russula earlei]|uniref:Uncharacterized protein n=1 Tax=Russula earlei TaxID=71964 RepID=A0ACC0U926_9AGAM|nr:hypothetical protein F5148DRAFT_1149589 [Russula earlei]
MATNTCLTAISIIVAIGVICIPPPMLEVTLTPMPMPMPSPKLCGPAVLPPRREAGSVPLSLASYGVSVIRSCQSYRPASSSVDVHCSAALMWSTDTAIRMLRYLSRAAESGLWLWPLHRGCHSDSEIVVATTAGEENESKKEITDEKMKGYTHHAWQKVRKSNQSKKEDVPGEGNVKTKRREKCMHKNNRRNLVLQWWSNCRNTVKAGRMMQRRKHGSYRMYGRIMAYIYEPEQREREDDLYPGIDMA